MYYKAQFQDGDYLLGYVANMHHHVRTSGDLPQGFQMTRHTTAPHVDFEYPGLGTSPPGHDT